MDPLGNLIDWAAPYGVSGLFIMAFIERLAPIVPSYGLLVAVGISAEAGAWPVGLAVLATLGGSLAGCLLVYGLCAAIGEARSAAFLIRFSRLFGISSERMDRMLAELRHRRNMLAFGAQLVPTVRLVAPGVAGFLRIGLRSFVWASSWGVALWNGLFIGVGYLAPGFVDPENATTLALQVLVVLVLCELLAYMAWKRLRAARVSQR